VTRGPSTAACQPPATRRVTVSTRPRLHAGRTERSDVRAHGSSAGRPASAACLSPHRPRTCRAGSPGTVQDDLLAGDDDQLAEHGGHLGGGTARRDVGVQVAGQVLAGRLGLAHRAGQTRQSGHSRGPRPERRYGFVGSFGAWNGARDLGPSWRPVRGGPLLCHAVATDAAGSGGHGKKARTPAAPRRARRRCGGDNDRAHDRAPKRGCAPPRAMDSRHDATSISGPTRRERRR
jgi:hypothetical protein